MIIENSNLHDTHTMFMSAVLLTFRAPVESSLFVNIIVTHAPHARESTYTPNDLSHPTYLLGDLPGRSLLCGLFGSCLDKILLSHGV